MDIKIVRERSLRRLAHIEEQRRRWYPNDPTSPYDAEIVRIKARWLDNPEPPAVETIDIDVAEEL